MATLTTQPYVNTKTDYNDERHNIFELQTFLKKISQTEPTVPFLNADGIYGEKTREAVKKYQELRRLPVTGTADYDTWNKISDEYFKLIELTAEALPFYVFPPELLEIKTGDSGDAVYVIQLILNNFALVYSNFSSIPVTGSYGSETAEAVKNFQSASMLTQTGTVDRPTWNEMTRLYRTFLINK